MDIILIQTYPDTNASISYKHSNSHFTETLITGNKTSSGKCVGYCNFNQHKGFLNKKLIDKHCCHEKKCPFFYTVNSLADEQKNYDSENREEIIKVAANKAIEKYDYVKIVGVRKCKKYFLLSYASVCGINEIKLSEIIQQKCNVNVMLKLINQPFEKMVSIVYGI